MLLVGECSTSIVQCNTDCLNGDSLSGTVGSLSTLSRRGVGIFIGLVGAVNSDLDSDLTALDLLSIHLSDGLLLLFLRGKGNETEATALAGFVASLELLNHETRDRAKCDLGRGWLISSKEFLEL
jgi:hypothetical protein